MERTKKKMDSKWNGQTLRSYEKIYTEEKRLEITKNVYKIIHRISYIVFE